MHLTKERGQRCFIIKAIGVNPTFDPVQSIGMCLCSCRENCSSFFYLYVLAHAQGERGYLR